ncbi:uncharacterized protein LOC115683805 isoform X2 [Syzygium oleosum]|uniref:uncharacterized protein LOC115683805 isoform X2 n=1 Tax=Syzygium oleosum TaxID=219896 RepID=UPI0024BA8E46|nr:uncharacterized protein LOC115683805 isoform X2 [Syzygium oleosum]
MEFKKQGRSSSSFTADIFGDKELPPSSSSTGVFASIFPPPQSVVGSKSSSEVIGYRQKHHNENQVWNSKQDNPVSPERASCNTTNKDGSIFREERGEPCHLSSSIYYGGRDVYSLSPGAQTSASNPILKKDGGEDDQNGANSVSGASRGNWWQGMNVNEDAESREAVIAHLSSNGSYFCRFALLLGSCLLKA